MYRKHFALTRFPFDLELEPQALFASATLAEADDLIDLADRAGAQLQVGHIERFNPALRAVARRIDNPRFIEAVRVAPYPFRATDVGVVGAVGDPSDEAASVVHRAHEGQVVEVGSAVEGVVHCVLHPRQRIEAPEAGGELVRLVPLVAVSIH